MALFDSSAEEMTGNRMRERGSARVGFPYQSQGSAAKCFHALS